MYCLFYRISTSQILKAKAFLCQKRYFHPLCHHPPALSKFLVLEPSPKFLNFRVRNFKDFYREPDPIPRRQVLIVAGVILTMVGASVNWPR